MWYFYGYQPGGACPDDLWGHLLLFRTAFRSPDRYGTALYLGGMAESVDGGAEAQNVGAGICAKVWQ